MKRISKQVMAGNVKIGGGAPVTVQSMLNVPSTDIEGSVRQAVALEKAGCQILRAAIPDMDAVRLIPAIKEKIPFRSWRIFISIISLRLRPQRRAWIKSASIPATSAAMTA